jgi:hypothetical protein
MSGYQLRDRIGCCRVGDDHVFLDLDADRYFCLGPAMNEAFAALVTGANANTTAVEALVRSGVIVQVAQGRPSPCSIAPADRSVASAPPAMPHRILAPLARRLQWSNAAVRRPLAANIMRLCKLRELRDCRAPDPQVLGNLVASYQQARLVWSEQGRCLPTSLALMDDLIRRGFAPRFVFGVRLYPFEAHCWIELDGMLVCETPERVRSFKPIMVI